MSEYITISNTGKTITFSFSPEFFDRWADVVPLDDKGRPHVDVVHDPINRTVTVTPGTFGRRVGRHSNGNGGAYLGFSSKVYEEWPAHGKIEFPSPTFDSNGTITFAFPDELPTPAPRSTTTGKSAHDTRKDYSRDGFTTKTAAKKIPAAPIHPRWAQPPIPEKLEELLQKAEVAHAESRASIQAGNAPNPASVTTYNVQAPLNLALNLEGEAFYFTVPLTLRLKILSLLQADPNVKGDAPHGFD